MLSEPFIGCFQSKNKQTKKRNPRKREEQTDTTRSTDKDSNTDGGILGLFIRKGVVRTLYTQKGSWHYLYTDALLALFMHRGAVRTIYAQRSGWDYLYTEVWLGLGGTH